MNERSEQPHDEVHPRPLLFIPALIAGWAIIGFGIRSALSNSDDAHPFALLVHVVTFDLAHDLVIAPLVLVVGWLVAKVVPETARGPVRAACAASALFIVFSYPLVRRWGLRPSNSSALPLEYGRNLAIVIGLVWLVAAAVIVRRVRSNRTT